MAAVAGLLVLGLVAVIVTVLQRPLDATGTVSAAGGCHFDSSTTTSKPARRQHHRVPPVGRPQHSPAGATGSNPPAPPPTVPAGSDRCPSTSHGAVIDRNAQRAWLCTDGIASPKFPITTAITQPVPGTYSVYAKDRVTTSTFGGHFSYLDNFVAFTRGVNTGARIAFHAVPRNAAGAPFQPLDTVGDLDRRG